MKKTYVFLLLIVICQTVWALDVPRLKGRVNDYSNTLSVKEISTLEAKLKAFEDSTSTQIVILLMESLDGADLEGFSMRVAEAWKIGQKGKDNGVILSFFMKDHKDRIEVGYGLEHILTDAICQRILDKEVKPRCQEEKYYEAIDVATDKIIACMDGSYQKEIGPAMEQERKIIRICFISLIIGIVAGIMGYFHWSVAGIVGSIGSPIAWFIVFGVLSLGAGILAVIIGFIGGMIFHFLISIFLGGGVTGSDFGDGVLFAGGSGGDDSGDSFSGGDGSFGGGGASGGW